MVKCFVLEVEVKHHHQLENSNHLNGLIPCFYRSCHRDGSALWNKVIGNGSGIGPKKSNHSNSFRLFQQVYNRLHNKTDMRGTVYADRCADILSLYLFFQFIVTYITDIFPPVIEHCHWKIRKINHKMQIYFLQFAALKMQMSNMI